MTEPSGQEAGFASKIARHAGFLDRREPRGQGRGDRQDGLCDVRLAFWSLNFRDRLAPFAFEVWPCVWALTSGLKGRFWQPCTWKGMETLALAPSRPSGCLRSALVTARGVVLEVRAIDCDVDALSCSGMPVGGHADALDERRHRA